ncbi:hypothetical protein KGY73_07710 [bacterium]|nr:hypothetical protein [bacterium]
MKKRIFFSFILSLIIVFGSLGSPFASVDSNPQQKSQIKKAKIYQDIYPLISEKDLYCSFFILEKELDTKIIGAERQYERSLLNESDIIYLNKGEKDGLKPGQVFMVLEVGPPVENYGPLANRRGRARIITLEEERASARIEKSCGKIMLGNFLRPFREKEGLEGKDLGYDVPPKETPGVKGKIIHLQDNFHQLGRGHWALINIGTEEGIQRGQQLIIYRRVKKGVPIHILGNSVVIDAQTHTSTIKILSCEDVIRLGDQIQFHPSQPY